MNRQQLDQQLDYLRRALTQLSHEMLYIEGAQLQVMRVRHARLKAELERVEAMRHGTLAVAATNLPLVRMLQG